MTKYVKFVQYCHGRIISHRRGGRKYIYALPFEGEFSKEWKGYGGENRRPVVFRVRPDTPCLVGVIGGGKYKRTTAKNALYHLRRIAAKAGRSPSVGGRNFEVILIT